MEILRRNLDGDQLAIAQEAHRSLLVLAPPGSGKTRLLTNVAAHRLRASSQQSFRICCLTFGVEAAKEIRTRLADPSLRVPPGRYWVGNFHQLGAFLLTRWGHLIGWPRDAGILVPPENEELIAGILSSMGIRGMRSRDAATAISRLKGHRSLPCNMPSVPLREVRACYDKELVRRRLRDFDDLIIHTLQLLREQPRVAQVWRDAYPYLFVDELQDTNLLQLDLITELLGNSGSVFGVADDDQMIYAWRDARPENIAEFEQRFEAQVRSLRWNYRCPPCVVAAANSVITSNNRARTHLMESRRPDIDGEVLLRGASGEEAEAELVADLIHAELMAQTAPGEIAVLAPVKFRFPRVRAALEARSIAYVAVGFDELINVSSIRALRGCLSAVGGGDLLREDTKRACEFAGEDWLSTVQAERAVMLAKKSSPRSLLRDLIAALGLGSLRAPSRDPDSVWLLGKMVQRAIADNEPPDAPELARVVLMEWGRLEAAALHAENAVKIMTSFLAKGTEYDVVILPFLNEGLVPYAPKSQQIDWEEARRIFYVSLTRAKRRVVMTRDLSRPDSPLLNYVRDAACLTEG